VLRLGRRGINPRPTLIYGLLGRLALSRWAGTGDPPRGDATIRSTHALQPYERTTAGTHNHRVGRALADPASHTTVRTVPYTAVRCESDGSGRMGTLLVSLKEVEEAELIEMAIWEGLVHPRGP